MKLSIALVLKGYPRLSETFIAQEIKALEEKGLDILLVSLRHPTDLSIHPIHDEIKANVLYLPEYLHREPVRCFLGFITCLSKPGFRRALRFWLKDIVRDPSLNRIRRFGQAMVLSRELPSGIRRLYAHFIHTPGSVSRYTAEMLNMPWSASAHAKDIWTTPQWEIREKLNHLEWLVTCTRSNADYLRSLCENPEKIDLVYHGIDLRRFRPPPADIRVCGNRSITRLISVGRAVPKKGYFDLLEALSHLPTSLQWSLTHIGGGPLLDDLRAKSLELNLAERIQWMGAMTQDQVIEQYRQSDVFVLPSRIHKDGDRDGLPNVLMEAQSQQLCCISTDISGIPELIENNVTGILVPQKSPRLLAAAIEKMILNPGLREKMSRAGNEKVVKEFSMEKGIERLIEHFQQKDS